MQVSTTLRLQQTDDSSICQNDKRLQEAEHAFMLKKLREIVRAWIQSPEDDHIVTLVQVALEDAALGDQLLTLLALPHAERTRRLRAWQIELQAEGAPEELIAILARLEAEALANQTYLVLQKARTAG